MTEVTEQEGILERMRLAEMKCLAGSHTNVEHVKAALYDEWPRIKALLAAQVREKAGERLPMEDLLRERDEFIVSQGLWDAFLSSLHAPERTSDLGPIPIYSTTEDAPCAAPMVCRWCGVLHYGGPENCGKPEAEPARAQAAEPKGEG